MIAHPEPAVTVEGLTKRYARRTVVDEVTFSIPRGVVAGFIGPNGAGKTTTMAMLLGLVRPTGGTGTVLGRDLRRPGAYLKRVGALIEGPGLWPGLTGTENLHGLAVLGGHDPAQVPRLLDTVGLAGRAGDRFGRYSLGMKQRLGLAAALLGDPDLLIIDEPTNGLDPVGIREMRDLIATLAEGGRTVLVSSHILAELEQVCDHLLVIEGGRILYAGTAERFAASASSGIVTVPENPGDLDRLLRLALDTGHDAVRDGASVTLSSTPEEAHASAARFNRVAAEAGITLAELHVRRSTLESHYFCLLDGRSAQPRTDPSSAPVLEGSSR